MHVDDSSLISQVITWYSILKNVRTYLRTYATYLVPKLPLQPHPIHQQPKNEKSFSAAAFLFFLLLLLLLLQHNSLTHLLSHSLLNQDSSFTSFNDKLNPHSLISINQQRQCFSSKPSHSPPLLQLSVSPHQWKALQSHKQTRSQLL